MALIQNRNLNIVVLWLALNLLLLVLYSFLRGYHDTHLIATIVSVRLAVGITIGLFAGIVVLAARLSRIPGSQFNLVKLVVYTTTTAVTVLACYNLLETLMW